MTLRGDIERVVVLLRPAQLYDAGFVEELATLHDALENDLPYLDEIASLVNARHLVGSTDTLISENRLDEISRSPDSLEGFRRRVQANPLYRNYIIAADESATAIVTELDGALSVSSITPGPGLDDRDDLFEGSCFRR